MRRLPILLLAVSTCAAQAQIKLSNPIDLTGYIGGARTIWFDNDSKYVYSDFKDYVKWDIAGKKIISKQQIPGYNTHHSVMNVSTGLWAQGNSNYNNPDKPNIVDMHRNINVLKDGKIVSRKIELGISEGDLMPTGTAGIFTVASGADYKYKAMLYDVVTGEEGPTYFSETADGKGVPSAISISPDASKVAITLTETVKGLRIYDIKTATLLHKVAAKTSGYGAQFSADGKSVFFLDGKEVIQIDAETGKEMKRMRTSSDLKRIAVTSDNKYAIAAGIMSGVFLLDLENGKELQQLAKSRAYDVKVSPGNKYFGIGVQQSFQHESAPTIVLFEILSGVSTDQGQTVTAVSPGDPPPPPPPPPTPKPKPEKAEWQSYLFKEAGYGVSLPMQPKVKAPEEGSTSPYTHSVQGSAGPHGYTVSMRRLKKSYSSKKALKYCSAQAKHFAGNLGASIGDEKPASVSGVLGKRYTMVKDKITYAYYVFVKGANLYQVIYLNAGGGLNTEEHTQFYKSFKIQ